MDTSYLTKQVTSIVGQLHNLFDEIGVPHHERDSRESELFSSLSETLHNHLRIVSSEKNEMVEEGQRIIITIQQMEASLDDQKRSDLYASLNEELTITYPLLECLRTLKEKHRTISKLHHERYEQVKKLVQALESYSSHLEPSFIQIKLPPTSSGADVPPTFDLSPSYINSVDAEFSRVYEEYTKRVTVVQQYSEDIVKLWAELGTPQAQTESTIIEHWRDSPEQLGLHKDDLSHLKHRREKLFEEKKGREKKMKELRGAVECLWDRLTVNQQDRKAFLASNRGCGLRTINDLEDELSRLNELKRQNLHLFVEDARKKLHALWDELYISEEEAVEFTPMFCDIYSDALLSAHEGEISRLETLKEQRAPTLDLIAKHRSIIQDRDDLAASSQDASRLIAKKGERHDPTRLLREEKMRKRIARELPKVEQKLVNILENFEEEYGRPFLVFGERYLDVITASNAKAPPPRSKTPNGMQPPPRSMAKSAPQSQRGTANRDMSTLRSKTPVDTSTLNRNPLASSRSAHTNDSNQKSPSRIPARVPLGNMPHGSNSPERHRFQPNTTTRGQENHDSSTIRSNIGPPMAPPPKMRDLYNPPSSSTCGTPSGAHPGDVLRSGSVVRQVPPEDPYADPHAMHRSHLNSSQLSNSTLHATQQHREPQRDNREYREMPPPPRPIFPHQKSHAQHYNPQSQYYDSHRDAASTVSGSSANSRQISANSSVAGHSIASSQTTAASGSENWETFEDSECEDELEYAEPPQRMWAAGSKRLLDPRQGGYGCGAQHGGGEYANTNGKRLKKDGAAFETIVENDNDGDNRRVPSLVEGSDAGWTDEDGC